MSKTRIKVTDRRMFTADGELRDTFKSEPTSSEAAPKAPDHGAPTPSAAPRATASAPRGQAPAAGQIVPETAPSTAEAEADEPLQSGATFHDLVGLLAQSASVYLAQAAQHIENRAELMEMARMHVDLLTIVQRKSRGNLDAAEEALLEKALYQLRMAFVQHG